MAEKKSKTKKTSVATAKQEMLTAYSEAVQEIEPQREAEMKPEEKAAAKDRKAVIATADSLTTEEVAKEIGALKGEIGKALAQIGDLLEAEVGRYAEIKRAVEAKGKELEEIYDIQKAASTLAALLEVQQQKREEFELEMETRRNDLTSEVVRLRAEWEAEKKRHEAEIKEREAAEQKRHDREREEYDYKFKREQQLAREQFEDQKARIERDWQLKKAAMESALAEREKTVVQRENELAELRQRGANAPKELEAAVARAVKEVTERLQRESQGREELARKEFEGERNVLMARIESMERTIKDQSTQILKLSQQIDKAYGQVQDIAVKTVEGVARAKAHAEQLAVEQTRKQTQEK